MKPKVPRFVSKRRKDKSKKGVLRKITTIIFFAFLLFIFGTLIYQSPNLIKIEKVECVNQFGRCSVELEQYLNEYDGENISKVKSGIINKLDSNLFVKEYSINFQLPSTLRVHVLERKALYAIKNDERYFLVGPEGVVFREEDFSNLPVVEMRGLYEVGQVITAEDMFVLDITKEVGEYYKVTKAMVDKDYLIVLLGSGEKVIFPNDGDRQLLIGSLNLILLQLNSENQDTRIEQSRKVREIDLRYKNPVLRF